MSRVFVAFLAFWTMLLSGCGFQLRGQASLPFTNAYVSAADKSILAPALRHELASQGKLAGTVKEAQVHIRVVDELFAKDILSLSGGGKVREYRLNYKVVLHVADDMGRELIAPIELQQLREYSYDDRLILAKEAEEASLRRAMEQEVLSQVMRRLAYVKR